MEIQNAASNCTVDFDYCCFNDLIGWVLTIWFSVAETYTESIAENSLSIVWSVRLMGPLSFTFGGNRNSFHCQMLCAQKRRRLIRLKKKGARAPSVSHTTRTRGIHFRINQAWQLYEFVCVWITLCRIVLNLTLHKNNSMRQSPPQLQFEWWRRQPSIWPITCHCRCERLSACSGNRPWMRSFSTIESRGVTWLVLIETNPMQPLHCCILYSEHFNSTRVDSQWGGNDVHDCRLSLLHARPKKFFSITFVLLIARN